MELNDDDQCIAGFDILVKLIQNIIKNPSDEKFRKIKKSNKAISTKLMNLVSEEKMIELIETLGYVKDADDDDQYSFIGEHYSWIMIGEKVLGEQSIRLKMKTMNEEDRKRQEKIFRVRDEQEALKKAKLLEKKRYE